jgi:hypothetical protein
MLVKLKNLYNSMKLPSNYDGYICTFDLDKTYLATEFETLSGLVKIPFETAADKKNIPGAASLVREIKKSKPSDHPVPVYFISGSPEGMEPVIKEKFKLDGVEIDGILFKDFKGALKKFQFKRLIDKIGFKLGALLYGRSNFPVNAVELLFGDDSEYDALIYSLYSDIVNRRLEPYEALTILKKWGLHPDELGFIEGILDDLKKKKSAENLAVKRIFIHLEVGRSPREFENLSSLVTPTYNHYQTAVILYTMNVITKNGLYRIISELIRLHQFHVMEFADSTEDLLVRGLIDKKGAKDLLKIVTKDNPLMQPRRWLLELSAELNRAIKNVKQVSSEVKKSAFGESDKSLVESYLSITPRRHV